MPQKGRWYGDEIRSMITNMQDEWGNTEKDRLLGARMDCLREDLKGCPWVLIAVTIGPRGHTIHAEKKQLKNE